MPIRRAWKYVRDLGARFIEHDDMSLAAAVAFYTVLSFAPLVLLLVTVGGFLGDDTKNDLLRFFSRQLGPRAAEVTEAVVEEAEAKRTPAEWWRWVVSVVVLLVGASAVFAQLQASLNRILNVKPRPGAGWWSWLRKRLLSMGMVLAMMFILLVALVLSAAVEYVMPLGEKWTGRIGAEVVSFLVTMLVIGAIFKVLPDVVIPWKRLWISAGLTALLFTAGKLAVGLYLEKGRVGEDYGQAAGGLIALLMWVYYSCVILFIGAEISARGVLRAKGDVVVEQRRPNHVEGARPAGEG